MAEETEGDRIISQFRYFDQNGDGSIDRTELLNVLQNFDALKWTEERVDRVLAAADLNKDSVIQYEEFVGWILGNSDDQNEFRQTASRIPSEAIDGLVRTVSHMSEKEGNMGIVEALQELQSVTWEQKEPAIATLLKLLQNIVKAPDNPKYRRIKRTNKILATKVFSVPGCAELLMGAGFVEEGEELVLPEGVDIQWVVDELTSFGNEELLEKLRAERDAKIAAARAEEAKSKELKGGHIGSNDEERCKILEKAEYDRQERVAREKLAAEGYREENFVPAEKGGGAVTRFSDVGIDLNKGGG